MFDKSKIPRRSETPRQRGGPAVCRAGSMSHNLARVIVGSGPPAGVGLGPRAFSPGYRLGADPTAGPWYGRR